MHRRTATKIKGGRPLRKNRHILTPNYWNTRQELIQIDIRKPGKGYKHFLKKKDITNFLNLLPNRTEIDTELDAIVLARGSYGLDGRYYNGVIEICAWEREMTQEWSLSHFEGHKAVLDRLEVQYEIKKDEVICNFTENQIKAYQLLHILLHELGHHHDRINTRSRQDCSRGENYAENYALKYEELIWTKYLQQFELY